MYYILLVLGFILLVKCADVFVDGSVGLAERFKVPSFIIGLTIVAMGTSAPEAAVSITAALAGQNDIATGNVIGSNMFNTLVVLGVCSMIKPIRIEPHLLKRDFPLNTIITIVMLLLSLDFLFVGSVNNYFSRADGIILLIFFVIYLLIVTIPEAKKGLFHSHTDNRKSKKSVPILPAIFKITIGIIGVVLGGKLVVTSASYIATSLGVSQNIIGLTIVAIGTSLPELITSIMAALKGESDIAIGNVLGSNLFNILFVLGSSCSIHPINISPISILDMSILLIVTILTMIFFWTHRTLNKIEGGILLLFYILYTLLLIVR